MDKRTTYNVKTAIDTLYGLDMSNFQNHWKNLSDNEREYIRFILAREVDLDKLAKVKMYLSISNEHLCNDVFECCNLKKVKEPKEEKEKIEDHKRDDSVFLSEIKKNLARMIENKEDLCEIMKMIFDGCYPIYSGIVSSISAVQSASYELNVQKLQLKAKILAEYKHELEQKDLPFSLVSELVKIEAQRLL